MTTPKNGTRKSPTALKNRRNLSGRTPIDWEMPKCKADLTLILQQGAQKTSIISPTSQDKQKEKNRLEKLSKANKRLFRNLTCKTGKSAEKDASMLNLFEDSSNQKTAENAYQHTFLEFKNQGLTC